MNYVRDSTVPSAVTYSHGFIKIPREAFLFRGKLVKNANQLSSRLSLCTQASLQQR